MVKDGRGSHTYVFTDVIQEGEIWGGASIIPGSKAEMSSLCAEYCGAIDISLNLYAIQVYMGDQYEPSKYQVIIWIDNAETLA